MSNLKCILHIGEGSQNGAIVKLTNETLNKCKNCQLFRGHLSKYKRLSLPDNVSPESGEGSQNGAIVKLTNETLNKCKNCQLFRGHLSKYKRLSLPDNVSPESGLVCGKIKADNPPTMRIAEDGHSFYFSMFSHMNLTETGPYEMVRGTKNLQELGHIVSYKGKKVMKQWRDPYCGMINGSDASVFPPVDEQPLQRLYTFEPEVCRSLYANLVGPANIFNMDAIFYEIKEEALAAKSANPANKCFCRRNWSANHDGCLLMGVLDLEPCQGAPALATLPHFYLASEELLEYFEDGISPDKEKHNTYVYLEPITGVVLKGLRRLQFNIELRQMKEVPQLENVRTGVFPLLWIEEGAELPPEIQQELKQSHTLLGYVEIGRWALLAIAVVVTLVSLIRLARTGALPICGQHTNSVSFVLSASNGNKLH